MSEDKKKEKGSKKTDEKTTKENENPSDKTAEEIVEEPIKEAPKKGLETEKVGPCSGKEKKDGYNFWEQFESGEGIIEDFKKQGVLIDSVILNKIAVIERCIKRINEIYKEELFNTNYNIQDIVLLNLQKACVATISLALRVIRLKKLGIPQKTREVFIALQEAKIISAELSKKLQAMVGFKNIAVHDYKAINTDIVKAIIAKNLPDLLNFTEIILSEF